MTYTEPRPKIKCKLKPGLPLPLIETTSGKIFRFRGSFNGFCVEVKGEKEMKSLITNGYFGKATLSRNFPQFNQHKPEIIRKRIYENRKNWNEKIKKTPQNIIVVPDSSSDSDENENYFTNLKPLYQVDHSGIEENVHLTLEEAFFLAEGLNCLDITYEGKKLEVLEAWNLFQQTDKYFLPNYIAYYHFRSKNWVVKTGIKFGGDFLLYKQGPPFYHASFVVVIHVVDEYLRIISRFNRRSMKYVHLLGLNRLCETAGKELLICEITWPSTVDQVSFKDLRVFKIKEIIMRRWNPSQEEINESVGPSTSTTV